MDWHGRVALVTGGSRGIGRAICLQLAQAGLKVAVNYHSQREGADATVSAITAAGGDACAFQADVSQTEAVTGLVGQVLERFGPVDVLVNNAGVTRDTLLLRMRPEDWDGVIQTDLSSVYLMCRAVLKVMLKQRFGRIINISSIAGISGNVGQVNYAAAKAGVLGLTRSLAKEVGSRGITVNAVAPGLIDTEMLEGMGNAHYEAVISQIALGRIGRPEDVAEAVWYLTQAAYVTGQTLVVDGGLLTV